MRYSIQRIDKHKFSEQKSNHIKFDFDTLKLSQHEN